MKKSALSLMMAVALGACGTQEPAVNQGAPQSAEDDLFAGFEVGGKTWDAVGSLGVIYQGKWYGPLCTATLVGPNTILSAKHCSQGLFGQYDMAWAPGSENATAPTVTYPLVDSWLASPASGGALRIGSDVSVFFADEPITGITPMQISAEPLTAADIDRPFYAIGYGTQNNAQDAGAEPIPGTRKLGKITLNAISGKKFEALFGTYEGFLANLKELGVDMDACLKDAFCAQAVADLWEQEIFADYEAYLGNRAGEAQVCHGDSGGPLVGVVTETGAQSAAPQKKVRKIYGVASNVWFSGSQACYGNFYATFGPEVAPWLDKALQWTDPCGDLTAAGVCDGTVASRCTTPSEGNRRVATMDCADLDQICTALADGKVGCADAANEPGDQSQPEPTPAPSEARAKISNAFHGLTSPAAATVFSK